MSIPFHLEPLEPAAYMKNITREVKDNPWKYICKAPEDPDYTWNDAGGLYYYALPVTETITFDCSQSPQVSRPKLTPPSFRCFRNSILTHSVTTSKQVASWFTERFEDIGRDPGPSTLEVNE